MAIVVEDGSIVSNANSYVTTTELTTYATARGLTVPSSTSDLEILLVKAMDYLESRDYKGVRTDDDQIWSWPRRSVYANDRLIESNEIPLELKNAQCEVAIAWNSQDLLVNENYSNVASEELDVLKVSYHPGGKRTRVNLSRVHAYLRVLTLDTLSLVRT